MAGSEFDSFCRFAFRFLEDREIRYLVVGGLAEDVAPWNRLHDVLSRSRANEME